MTNDQIREALSKATNRQLMMVLPYTGTREQMLDAVVDMVYDNYMTVAEVLSVK